MPTLTHPAFPDVTREVDDEAAERWELAGWLRDEPKSSRKPKKTKDSSPATAR